MSASSEKQLSTDIQKLGILAGGGNVPKALIEYCKQQSIDLFVVAFENQSDLELGDDIPHIWARLGASGRTIKTLKDEGVKDLVLIGKIRRPSLAELKPDLKTAEFFAKEGLNALGDDGLLKALKRFLEKEGFTLHGIQAVMPQILTPARNISSIKPSKQHERDIERGCALLDSLGDQDVGQSVVVQQGHVLGIEGAEGTDELIRRCAGLQRKGEGAVLVKLCKRDQDRDLDLPTIGPQTIEELASAGFAGVAIHAGNSIVDDLERVKLLAKAGRVFVVGILPEDYKPS